MYDRIRRIRQALGERVRPMRVAWADLGLEVDDLDEAIGRLGLAGLQAHGLSERLHDLRLALSTWIWRRYRLAGALQDLKDAILGSSGDQRQS